MENQHLLMTKPVFLSLTQSPSPTKTTLLSGDKPSIPWSEKCARVHVEDRNHSCTCMEGKLYS